MNYISYSKLKNKKIIIQNKLCFTPTGKTLKRNTYYFRIPDGSLGKVFKDFKKERDRYNVIKMLSLIQLSQVREDVFDSNGFVSISKKVFEKSCGKGYSKYLKYLIHEVQLVDPFLSKFGTQSYFTGNDVVKKFCKKYKFSKKFNFQTVVWTQNDLIPSGLIDGNMIFTLGGQHEDELVHCLNFERKLSLDVSGLDEIDEDLIGLYSDWMERFNHGNFIPKLPEKSTRFHFNSVMLDNRFKKYLRYEGKNNLINFDVRCCYPSFLKEILGKRVDTFLDTNINNNNNKDKVGYNNYNQQMCPVPPVTNENTDFYSQIGDGLGLSRNTIKKEFNSFVNSEKRTKERHPFFKRLHQMGYGPMGDFIKNTDDLWKVLEGFETELICKLISRCIDENVPINRQHDGFLVLKENVPQIERFLKEILKDYRFIHFESKPLCEMESKKETRLLDENNLSKRTGYEKIEDIKDSLWILNKIKWSLSNKGKDITEVSDGIRFMDEQLRQEYEWLSIKECLESF